MKNEELRVKNFFQALLKFFILHSSLFTNFCIFALNERSKQNIGSHQHL